MKTILRIKLFLLASLLAFVSGSAYAQSEVTIWSEDWTGIGTKTPSAFNATLYQQSNTGTHGYSDNYAGGTSPELMLKSKTTWTITLTDLKGYKGGDELTLSYRANKTTLAVSLNGTTLTKSGSNPYTCKTTLSETPTSIVIVFSSTGSDNVRLDNLSLTYVPSATDKSPHGLAFAESSYEITEFSFTAPTLTNPNNLPVSYASSNAAVASVDAATGVVTVVGYGTTEITASFVGNDTYAAGSASYTLKVKDPNVATYEKITSADELTVGDTYIIVYTAGKKAMGKISSNAAAQLDVNIDAETGLATLDVENSADYPYEVVITNSTTSGKYNLTSKQGAILVHTSDTKLYSGSTTSTSATGDLSISFVNGTGEAEISGGTKRYISYDTSAGFKHYSFSSSNSYKKPHLYKKQGGTVVPPPLTVADPTLVALGETFDESISVSVQHADATVTIYYTTDESVGTSEDNIGGTGWTVWTDWSTPLTFTSTTTLYVVAVKGDVKSNVVSQTYTKKEEMVEQTVTFDFTTQNPYGMTTKTSGNSYETSVSEIEESPVTIKFTGNYRSWYVSNGSRYELRVHKNSTFTLSVPEGMQITKVEFTGETLTGLDDVSEPTSSVTYTQSDTRNINTITVHYTTPGAKISVGTTGFSTWYDSQRSLTVPEGVDAYTFVEGAGNTLQAVKSFPAGEVIPKDVAVVLFSKEAKEEAKQYAFVVAANETYDNSANLLKGTDEKEEVFVSGTGTKLYKLANGTEGVGFYQASADGTSFMNGAHKAYLEISTTLTDAMGTRPFVFGEDFGEDVTSLMQQLIEQTPDGATFDLQGRRVVKPSHGLYIVNGKKMFIK